jgi:hypothetical protein
MKATAAFLIFFLLIAPKSRALLFGWVGDGATWVTAWAPVSYVIIGLVVAAPLAAVLLMMKGPKRVEPQNPLARYKHEDVLD